MSHRKKVLIIEDEEDLRILLKDYFAKKHYDVVVSGTLAEGREVLKTKGADILFLDNNLPDGAGWNLAPVFASDFPDLYIVLISAFHPTVPDMPADARFWVIEKPIAFSDLDKQFSAF